MIPKPAAAAPAWTCTLRPHPTPHPRPVALNASWVQQCAGTSPPGIPKLLQFETPRLTAFQPRSCLTKHELSSPSPIFDGRRKQSSESRGHLLHSRSRVGLRFKPVVRAPHLEPEPLSLRSMTTVGCRQWLRRAEQKRLLGTAVPRSFLHVHLPSNFSCTIVSLIDTEA